MKSINKFQLKYFIIFFLIVGCISTPKVFFKEPVDTKTKKISFQKKKSFLI